MRRLVPVLAALALALPSAAGARTVVSDGFHSRALAGTLRFDIWLPAGYAAHPRRRYPVVYFLHGLPASPSGYHGARFVAAAAQGRAIVVAPQGAKANDADPEYLDLGPGRNWTTAIARELPAYVDAHYRTIANRHGRALVGLSAGGYGAALLGLNDVRDFSVIESWSGYFHATDPSGERTLDLGSAGANERASVHRVVPGLRRTFAAHPTFLAFYIGRGDTRFRAENEQLNRELAAAGVPHVFRLYAGGHSSALWYQHARRWVGLALAHLQRR